jgi:hypothetical protein
LSPGHERHLALGWGVVALGLGLAANSLLGPLAFEVIRYRFSETLIAQGIGLDLVSLVVVAPLLVGAGLLTLRAHAAGPVLALAPSLYTAYMSVQYVIGPEYLALPGNNERFFMLHLALLVLALVGAAGAWAVVDPIDLPPESARGERRWGALLLGLAALLVLRYLPAIVQLAAGGPRVAEYRENPTSFLLIATMDLGLFVPAAVAAGLALRRGRGWARKALPALIGWLALVGLAVAAMAVVMRVQGDPAASTGQVVAFAIAGAVLVVLALRLCGPLLRRAPQSAD